MWADNETSEDLLGFQVHADLIRVVVTDPKLLPTTIGLFGDWGSGKTSIMRMLEKGLHESADEQNGPKVLHVYFNGWLFEGYEDAKAAMLGAIVRELANHKTIGNRIKDEASDLLKSIDWMRLVRSGTKNIAVPALLAFLSSGATLPLSHAAAALNALKSGGDPPSPETDSKDEPKMSDAAVAVRTFQERFGEMIRKTKLESLVILIDDLDRCTPERIIASLEAIKLFLNVEGTAFVIGADERIVRRAIAASYSAEKGQSLQDDDPLVRDYLEKLVQIPYHIPRMSPSEVESYMALLFCKRDLADAKFTKCLTAFHTLREKDKYTTFGFAHVERALEQTGIDELLRSSLLFCGKAAPLITECLKGNPRQIKRFLNAYVLRKELAKAANLDQLCDDVLLKLMILEYMRLERFRELSDLQSVQDGRPKELQEMEECLASGSTSGETLEAIGEVLQNWKSEDLVKWLNLDPRLAGIDLRDYFWIARDKLQTTLSGVILLPPEIRRLLEDLLSGTAGREAAVTGEVKKLDAEQRESLLDALERRIVVHPDERNAYLVLARLVNSDVEGAIQSLVQGLEQVSPTSIPKAVFPALLQLELQPNAKPALQGVLERLRKDSKIAKLLEPGKRTLRGGNREVGTSKDYSPPTASSWRPNKNVLDGHVHSGHVNKQDAFRFVNGYIGANGGAARMARTGGAQGKAKAGQRIAMAFGGFISDVANRGLEEALRGVGLESLAGGGAEEILYGLVDRLAGDGGTNDDVDARNAQAWFLDELLQDAETADDVEVILKEVYESGQMESLLRRFFAQYLNQQFCRTHCQGVTRRLGSRDADRFFGDVRAFIEEEFNLELDGEDLTHVDWNGQAGRDICEEIQRRTLDAFKDNLS